MTESKTLLSRLASPFISPQWLALRSPAMWSLYDQSIVSGANFLTMLILARTLGVAAFGEFALAYTVLIFLNNLQRAYITQPLNVLAAATDAQHMAHQTMAMLKLHAIIIPLGGIVVAVSSIFFFPKPALAIAAMVYLASWQLQEFFRRAWYTSGNVTKACINDGVSYGGQLLIIAWAASLNRLDGPTAFYLMAATSTLALLIVPVQKIRLDRATIADCLVIIRSHWKFGRWLVFGVFAIWGASQLYPFILQLAGGAIMVGTFVASRNLLNGVGILVQAMNSYMPGKARIIVTTHGRDALLRYLTRMRWRLGLASGAVCLAIALFAEPILHLVYGATYADGANVIRLLAVGTVAATLTVMPTVGLMAIEQTKAIFVSNLIATTFTLAGGVPLVWLFGAEGAAIALSVGLLVVLAAQHLALRRGIALYKKHETSIGGAA